MLFLCSRRKNPCVPPSLYRLACLPHPASFSRCRGPCRASELPDPASAVLLKAPCDDGGGAVHPYWCYWEEEKCPAMRTQDLYGN